MRKLFAGLLLAAASLAAFGQSAIIRGESSAGVYNNIQAGDGQTDGQSQFRTAASILPYTLLNNGTQWDRARNNLSSTAAVTALAAAGLGTVNGSDLVNFNARGIKLTIDITALAGTGPTLTVTVQGKDAVSGKYYTILASAALAAVATTVLTVYPGVAVTANVSASDILPRDWRVSYTVGGTGPSVTATVGAAYVN